MNVNVENLISEVFKHQCVWNQAHPDHHNRFVLEKKWEEVASILNTTKGNAKSKWKYLRDTFRKELAKCPKPKSGDGAAILIKSKWSYFKSLLFLKDQFTPRKSTSNLSCAIEMPVNSPDENETVDEAVDEAVDEDTQARNDTDTTQPSFAEDDADDSQIDTDFPPTPRSSTSFTSEPSREPRVALASRKRKRSDDMIGQALLNVEKEKLKLLQNKKEKVENKPMDEDRAFFESILPHVQKMEPLTKLQFRSKVQELIMWYAYNSQANSFPSGTTSSTEQPPNNNNTYQFPW